ncbi:MAG: 2-hydroxyacid dehydrogenase [Verrucomicrobia bacterium]|nr:2-hydroxyacid dehydrogenase [Verrucomicrobiota bacterium]
MKVAVFSTRAYDREYLMQAAEESRAAISFEFFEAHLQPKTAILAKGFDTVCAFVNDTLDQGVLKALRSDGVRLIALRCAGYNNVDLAAAAQLGITVARVPAYSPEAVAEHTVALILALNRKIYRAYNRVREANFSLEGLVGFNLHGKTVGLIGTGKIGKATTRILGPGFGCHLLGYDPLLDEECVRFGLRYVSLPELFAQSDIVSLHTPLFPETFHLINQSTIAQMKPGVMLINTSRGALIDTPAVIEALKTGQIGYLGLDVYEEETRLFFEDLSSRVIPDDVFARLLTFPNVIVTGHQAFLTQEALRRIARTTVENLTEFAATGCCRHQVAA